MGPHSSLVVITLVGCGVGVGTAGACRFDGAVPSGARIVCLSTANCPDGTTCDDVLARCIDPTSPPVQAKALEVAVVEDAATEMDVGEGARIVEPPSNGALVALETGLFAYTPAPDFFGVDVARYARFDERYGVETLPTTVTFRVEPVNDAPIAGDLEVTCVEDGAVAGLLPVEDIDDDELVVSLATEPAHGEVTFDGVVFLFTSGENETRATSFEYVVIDAAGASATGRVDLGVQPANDAPLIPDIERTVTSGSSVLVHLPTNDIDGDPLTFSLLRAPVLGSVVIDGDPQQLRYTAFPGVVGVDSLLLLVSDGTLTSAVARVEISVVSLADFTSLPPAPSCAAHLASGNVGTGSYVLTDGAVVVCDMESDGGGWTRVGHYDVDEGGPCPGEWLPPAGVPGCGRTDATASMRSATFASPIPYREVRAVIRAFGFGGPDAFNRLFVGAENSVDSFYVDGVSLTVGEPRRHVFTWAQGLVDNAIGSSDSCPCVDGAAAPAIVGDRYLCEAGDTSCCHFWDFTDVLWDGNQLGDTCRASPEGGSSVVLTLDGEETEPLEVRILHDEGADDEDLAVQKLDLFVR